MANAKIREKERDRVYQRKLVKESEQDGIGIGEKPMFITEAYKEKLKEKDLWDYEDKLAEEIEKRQDVKVKGMAGFYSNLMTKNIAIGGDVEKNAISAYTAGSMRGEKVLGEREKETEKEIEEESEEEEEIEREREIVREKEREREREVPKEKERRRDSRERERGSGRSRDDSRDRERDRDRERVREKDRDRERDRGKDRRDSRERDRRRDSSRDREKEKERDRHSDRDREKEKVRESERDREKATATTTNTSSGKVDQLAAARQRFLERKRNASTMLQNSDN